MAAVQTVNGFLLFGLRLQGKRSNHKLRMLERSRIRSEFETVPLPELLLLPGAQVLYQSAGITIVLGAISGRPEFHVRSDAGQTEKHTSS